MIIRSTARALRVMTSQQAERSAARFYSSSIEPHELLSQPSWSVRSLLPSEIGEHGQHEVSTKQLHRLLRLCAFPLPSTEDEEESMLRTLSAQLHFVKEMQSVDTTGVEPLQALRDETAAAEKEQTVDLKAVEDILHEEEVVGTFHRRIRRKSGSKTLEESVDMSRHAGRTIGKYLVVETAKA